MSPFLSMYSFFRARHDLGHTCPSPKSASLGLILLHFSAALSGLIAKRTGHRDIYVLRDEFKAI